MTPLPVRTTNEKAAFPRKRATGIRTPEGRRSPNDIINNASEQEQVPTRDNTRKISLAKMNILSETNTNTNTKSANKGDTSAANMELMSRQTELQKELGNIYLEIQAALLPKLSAPSTSSGVGKERQNDARVTPTATVGVDKYMKDMPRTFRGKETSMAMTMTMTDDVANNRRHGGDAGKWNERRRTMDIETDNYTLVASKCGSPLNEQTRIMEMNTSALLSNMNKIATE